MTTKIQIKSPNVRYTEKYIEAQYSYHTESVSRDESMYTVSRDNF